MKKFLSLFLALAMMLPLFGAQAEETVDLTPKSDKITIWYVNNENADVLYDEFARLHPEYELDHSVETTIAGWDQVMASLSAMAASGDVPDAIWVQLPTTIGYYSNFFQPIDKYLRNDPEFNLNDLAPAILDTTCLFNGEYWFMPDEFNANCMVYNKDLFEEAGLDPEAPPTTWSEMLEYAKILTKYDNEGVPTQLGYRGFSWNPGTVTFYEYLSSGFGTYMVDRLGLNWDLNNDKIKSILEFSWQFPAIYGGFDKLPADVSYDISTGKSAMTEYVVGWCRDLAVNSDINFGIAPLPHPDSEEKTYSGCGPGYFWAIPKGAKNPEGGWEWIKYYYTDGMYAAEKNFAEVNGLTWVPDYAIHLPTRQRINDTLMPLIEGEEKLMAIVDYINETYDKCEVSGYAAGYEAEFADPYFWPIFNQIQRKEIDMNSGLAELQDIADRLRDDWIERKKAEGWNFDVEEGMYPTPPQN